MKFSLRQIPAWKIGALIAGMLFILVLAVWGWIQLTIERRWAEMDRTIESLFEKARALEPPRPALRGDPLPGDAWDSYREALRHLRDPDAALEDLHRGARCGAAASPYGASAPDASLRFTAIREPWEELARIAAVQAEKFRKEGRTGEAVDVLLDLCQLGRDLAQNGSPSAWSEGEDVHRMTFAGIRDLLVQGVHQKADLARLGQSLRVLDETFHSKGSDLLIFGALVGRAIRNDQLEQLRVGYDSPYPPRLVRTWRSAWSLRLEKAKSFAFIAAWVGRMAAAESGSWSGSQGECERIRQEALAVEQNGRHPILQYIRFHRVRPDREGRQFRAKLRLLRVAAHYLATGEILDLKDPFGTCLRHSLAGGTLKIWSLDVDGIDNGGDGAWDAGNDLVLRVSR